MNDSNIKLSSQEEKKFRILTNKILSQQSLPEILSESDKKEFFKLLIKLELNPQIQEQNIQNKNNIRIIIGILSFISIYIVIVGIPIAIALILNISSLFIVYIIVGATTLSIVLIGGLMGKPSWGMVVVVYMLFLILYLIIGLILFLISKNFALISDNLLI